MTEEELNKFILKKNLRQEKLKERKRLLESLDTELSASKFTRSFRSYYYTFKRILLLITTFLLIVISFCLIFSPKEILKEVDKDEVLVEAYKRHYYKEAGRTVYESVLAVVKNEEISVKQFVEQLDNSVKKVVINDVIWLFRFSGFLLILLSITLLYVSRLTRKLKIRNRLINKADTLTQQIIEDYKHTINEEDRELEIILELIHKNQT